MSFLTRLIYGPDPAPPDEHPETTRPDETIREQVNANASAPPTEEERLWAPRLGQGVEEDYYWRRLSDNWYQKDVIPSTYLEIHNRCYEAYNANPLASRIVELITDFVLGDSVTVEAKHPRVQAIIDAFWRDPDNHMDTRVHSLVTELSLYGEQFIRFFVNPYSGEVKVGQIDPSLIDQIETDIDNVEHAIRFHQRPVGPGGALWSATAPVGGVSPDAVVGGGRGGLINAPPANATAPTLEPGAIYAPGDQVMAGTWYEAGSQVMQFKINAVSNAKRGKSDLATLLPWLRRYQDWLIDRVRINKYKSAFLWDITLQGADAKTIDRKRMQYAYAPSPGSVVVHNESEQWTAVQPKIAADDVAADGEAIKMMIAAGAGLPEHYLAEGGDVNRATAAEMGLPTYRRLVRRQRFVELLLRAIIDRVLDEATKAGRLGRILDRSYHIELPELTPGEDEARATAASTLITALTTARSQGWMSNDTAMRLLYEILDPAVNLAEEQARIKADPPPPPQPAAAPHPPAAAQAGAGRRANDRPQRPQAGGTGKA